MILLRILFGGLFLYFVIEGRAYAHQPQTGADLTVPAYVAICVVLAIPNALVWAPWLGSHLAEPISGQFTGGGHELRENFLTRAIQWLEKKNLRRCVLAASFVEGVIHPHQPWPFIIGMKHAKPASWLQKIFAREVYRFNHAQHCIEALRILREHGLEPGPHPDESVNRLLRLLDHEAAPGRAPVALPPPTRKPMPTRDPRIQIGERPASSGRNNPDGGQPPPAPQVDGLKPKLHTETAA